MKVMQKKVSLLIKRYNKERSWWSGILEIGDNRNCNCYCQTNLHFLLKACLYQENEEEEQEQDITQEKSKSIH